MSPEAPGRIAATTPKPPEKRSYESTYNRSALPTGDVAVRPLPVMDHSNLPDSGSYERNLPPPAVTSSVRFLFFQTYGVDQFVCSSRSTRHTSFPVRLSSATRNDFSSLSH